ncbi:hypothetical protein BH10BAC5_BH10BAC5_29340 [soil metagenome]
MKKLFSLVLLASSINCFAQISTSGSGWSWYGPGAMGNDVSSFSIAPDGTQYLCGVHGTLLKSTNGGLNFTPMGTISEADLKEIKVLENSLKIVVVGIEGAKKSTDGGAHWVSYAPGYTNLNTVAAKDNRVVMAGDNGKVITSSNSGVTFSQTYVNPVTDWKRIIEIPNTNSYGWIAIGSNGKIAASGDGGWFWSDVTNPSGGANLYGISFIDANIGMAVGANSKILKTTNGGVNWYLLSVSIGQDLFDVRMFDQQTAITTGAGGKIFRTSDGGSNWNEVYQNPSGKNLYTFDFFVDNTGYSWGEKGVYTKTTNAGLTWFDPDLEKKEYNLVVPTTWSNRKSAIGDTLIAVGNAGLFSKSTNSGLSWVSYNTGTTLDLETAFFIDGLTGWVAGGKSSPSLRIILKTSNGGLNWITQNSAASSKVYDIEFVNSITGVAVGNFGLILRTTNGGNNWISVPGVTYTLQDIVFLDESTAIAVGEAGRIFRTSNAGLNWTQVNSAGFLDMQFSVDFTDFNNGISVGSNGRMFKTTNSGNNWIALPVITLNSLNGICFTNNLTAFVCGTNLGNDCSVLKTTNAGLNWVRQNTGTNNILNSIYFKDANTGFAVGEAGTILRTTNGGVSIVGIQTISNEIPMTHYLSQNYPNPFNPVTKIKFSIPSGNNGIVKLIVFDMLGREVEKLVNKNLNPGTYEADWQSAKHSSGIYFYKLITENFTESKKMLLVR